ncbi:MAG: NAD(P)/FAD-dependent oxidoreductase [Fimbriimonadaceae bacterium]|nr:NAD(P)/FAD-dependent oxidoreductase [Alphaproteobacteria bacterium]
MPHYDVIIVGAGAAGLMCAIEAGKRGRSVLVLERNRKPAQKIRISGGGRCNFTNLDVSPSHFLSDNPHFCVSALKRYQPADFIALVEDYGIAYFEKTLGQLFCEASSQQIIDMLLAECGKYGVKISLSMHIHAMAQHETCFELKTNTGSFSAGSLVIATGGPSIPKMGATGYGYEIARQFGLNVISPRAGLVPLTFEETALSRLAKLAGVAADVDVSCGSRHFREALLFTHRGLSGPAILQISSYWRSGMEISINFAPDINLFDYLMEIRRSEPTRALQTVLGVILPKRLALFLCEEAQISGTLANLSNDKLRVIAETVTNWRVTPSGTEGYRTAEVVCGGVDTEELSSKTFESKRVPGLYFIGEVIDVTGHLGGYNFQWAWASGHAAGQYV